MRHPLRAAAVSAVLLPFALLVPGAAHAQRAEPVRFARGSHDAELSGEINDPGAREYVLRAAAGQVLSLTLESASSEAFFEVTAPGDGPGHARWRMTSESDAGAWSARLLESGDYRIRVRRRGAQAVRYHIHVAVTGAVQLPEQVAASARPGGHFARSRHGDLRVARTPDGRLRFALYVDGGEDGYYHFGEASGVVSLQGHTASYVNQRCRLDFRFAGDRVYLTQTGSDSDCDFGASVDANGVYSRLPDDGPSAQR